jgi:hypothetical protein
MPLFSDARSLIRANLDAIKRGEKAPLVAIGSLTQLQLAVIDEQRKASNHPPIMAEVLFIGRQVYKSRVERDGYTIEDVIEQIASGMDAAAIVLMDQTMTTLENPEPRVDRYGNSVRDKVVLECSVRHPRPELFPVIPRGGRIKPKRPLTR